MSLAYKVLEFATNAHNGQYRWDKSPYINHPRAVAEIAIKLTKTTKIYSIAPMGVYKKAVIIYILALCHDIAEDVTKYKDNEILCVEHLKKLDTKNILDEADWNTEILNGLVILNKNRYPSYLYYILGTKSNFFYKSSKNCRYNP